MKFKSNFSNGKNRFWPLLATTLLLLTIAVGGFLITKISRKNPATSEAPNVILISVDTLRADHLGAYGYGRNTSPNIDKLAQKSTVFENAYTPIPNTYPSYVSLFSGLYPLDHKEFSQRESKGMDKKIKTLAESFTQANYLTAGFISNKIISASPKGISRGFKTYDGIDQKDVRDDRQNTYGLSGDSLAFQKAERTSEEANAWLQKNHQNKFFLFVQYVDTHHPYGQSGDLKNKYTEEDNEFLSDPENQQKLVNTNSATAEEMEYFKNRYDEDVTYVDQYIGELLKNVESLGLSKNTIIIVTADHGESFDHEYLGHSFRAYQSSIKVPLIIYDPAIKLKQPQKTKEVASLIDLYPTLANRLSLKINPNLDGVDIGVALKGGGIKRTTVYSMSLPPWENVTINDPEKKLATPRFIGQLYALITKDKKIIYNQANGKKEAYDIAEDPEESKNIINTINPNHFEQLILWLSSHPLNEKNIKINDKLYQNLKGLGYLN